MKSPLLSITFAALLASPAHAFVLTFVTIDRSSTAPGDSMVIQIASGDRGEIDLGNFGVTPATAPAESTLASTVRTDSGTTIPIDFIDNSLGTGTKSGYVFNLDARDPFAVWSIPATTRTGGRSNPRVEPTGSFNLIFDYEIAGLGYGTMTWHLDEGPGQPILIDTPVFETVGPGQLSLSFDVTPGPGFDPNLPFVTLEGSGTFFTVPEPSRALLSLLGIALALARRRR